jgi:hypothetical protein
MGFLRSLAIVPVLFDEEFLMFVVKFVFEKLVENSIFLRKMESWSTQR